MLVTPSGGLIDGTFRMPTHEEVRRKVSLPLESTHRGPGRPAGWPALARQPGLARATMELPTSQRILRQDSQNSGNLGLRARTRLRV